MWRNCAASASAVLSLGLEKRGNIAVASGGLTCTWKWDLGNSWVAIKTFHTCSAQHLKEVKEVSITPARKLCHSQELPDAVEASADMEEVFPNILTFLGVNMTSFQLCLVLVSCPDVSGRGRWHQFKLIPARCRGSALNVWGTLYRKGPVTVTPP